METAAEKPVRPEPGLKRPVGGPRLSIIIVSYNVSGYLDHCLDSSIKACNGFPFEIIVVDNASTDNSADMVRKKYPNIKLIENARNVGYPQANNQGIVLARGQFILFLNPDTIIPSNGFIAAMDFLECRPDAGMVSVKLVNADGSFQLACRRGFPTPLTAFYRMTGLSLLFPKSRRFGRYNMTYLDENRESEVDVVCGAYMMVKADVLRQVGLFDEDYFMFGEDIDLCYRVSKAGYKVVYLPSSEVIHFKGRSSRKNRIKSAVHFYNSMLIFSKKYFSKKISFFPRSVLFAGILLNAVFKIGAGWLKLVLPHFLDLLIVNGTLVSALLIKFGLEDHFYRTTETAWYLLLHVSISLAFLLPCIIGEVYSGRPKTFREFFMVLFIGSLLFFTFIYFIPNVRFSRLAFAGTCAALFLLLPGWRYLFNRAALWMNTAVTRQNRIVIVGTGDMARKIYDKLGLRTHRYFKGFIAAGGGTQVGPGLVLGDVGRIRDIIREVKANEVIVATAEKGGFDYMGLINYCTQNHLHLKMVQGMHEAGKYCILDVNMSESTVI
jgi:GT2 family glycosyltransferase